MIPRCDDCRSNLGWTRYIRRVHYGLPVICWACSHAAAVYRNRYGDRLDARRSADG